MHDVITASDATLYDAYFSYMLSHEILIFLSESKSILPLVATTEDTIFIFTVHGFDFLWYLGLHSYQKGLKCRILVRNYAEHVYVTFRDRTADVTYCADVILFVHTTSGRLPLITAFFFFGDFSCFNRLYATKPDV